MRNRARAAGSISTRPCSQFRSVATGIRKILAIINRGWNPTEEDVGCEIESEAEIETALLKNLVAFDGAPAKRGLKCMCCLRSSHKQNYAASAVALAV